MPSERATPITPCMGSPRLFFSEDLVEQEHAKAICAMCPHRAPCLQRALDGHEVDGIWGGLDSIERSLWVRLFGRTVGPVVKPLPPAITARLRANKVMKTGPDANLEALEA